MGKECLRAAITAILVIILIDLAPMAWKIIKPSVERSRQLIRDCPHADGIGGLLKTIKGE